MDKNYIVSLTTLLLLLSSPVSFAERPAAEDTGEPVFIENDPAPAADMRPAAEDTMMPATDAASSARIETRTSGDVLDMSVTQSPAEAVAQPVKQLEFPRRGMSQDKVQNELGRPIEIIPPVGEPPISRWVYDDRVVYFEYSSVVHVVAK